MPQQGGSPTPSAFSVGEGVSVAEPMTETERNDLVEHHTELVRYLAHRIGRDLPPWMERDDLISYGWFGLIDAAKRFDPERGVARGLRVSRPITAYPVDGPSRTFTELAMI